MAEGLIVDRAIVGRLGRRLEYFAIQWNLLEGLVAVFVGLAAGSISRVEFGIDSFIEVTSGATLPLVVCAPKVYSADEADIVMESFHVEPENDMTNNSVRNDANDVERSDEQGRAIRKLATRRINPEWSFDTQ